MFQKYNWYKSFGTNKDIEDLPDDEVTAIMTIAGIMSEKEEECALRNRTKNG